MKIDPNSQCASIVLAKCLIAGDLGSIHTG